MFGHGRLAPTSIRAATLKNNAGLPGVAGLVIFSVHIPIPIEYNDALSVRSTVHDRGDILLSQLTEMEVPLF